VRTAGNGELMGSSRTNCEKCCASHGRFLASLKGVGESMDDYESRLGEQNEGYISRKILKQLLFL
jgi:hypothetical protein